MNTCSQSPYKEDNNVMARREISKDLIARHALFRDSHRCADAVHRAWNTVWKTMVGGTVPLYQVSVSSQTIGQFFETLLETELAGFWRPMRKSEKDFAHHADPFHNFELKMSSSSNRIFGNASYAKIGEGAEKDRSGFYLAINFEKPTIGTVPKIHMIRAGWIDASDWIPQKSDTGQSASLRQEVYDAQLCILWVNGNAPMNIVIPRLGMYQMRDAARLSEKHRRKYDTVLSTGFTYAKVDDPDPDSDPAIQCLDQSQDNDGQDLC